MARRGLNRTNFAARKGFNCINIVAPHIFQTVFGRRLGMVDHSAKWGGICKHYGRTNPR